MCLRKVIETASDNTKMLSVDRSSVNPFICLQNVFRVPTVHQAQFGTEDKNRIKQTLTLNSCGRRTDSTQIKACLMNVRWGRFYKRKYRGENIFPLAMRR